MERGMEESDAEGLATHGGPKSCDGAREDAGEALTGEPAGQAIEPRNQPRPGCRRRQAERKATSLEALGASFQGTPRGRRTRACREAPCARTGRAQQSPAL